MINIYKTETNKWVINQFNIANNWLLIVKVNQKCEYVDPPTEMGEIFGQVCSLDVDQHWFKLNILYTELRANWRATLAWLNNFFS